MATAPPLGGAGGGGDATATTEDARGASGSGSGSGSGAWKHPLAAGALVRVASRTDPGINKPGGVATVTAVRADRGEYDVRYVLHSGREAGVAFEFVEPHAFEEPKSRRTSARTAAENAPPPRPKPAASRSAAAAIALAIAADENRRTASNGSEAGAPLEPPPPRALEPEPLGKRLALGPEARRREGAEPDASLAAVQSAMATVSVAPPPVAAAPERSSASDVLAFKRTLRRAYLARGAECDVLPMSDVVRAVAEAGFTDATVVDGLLRALDQDNAVMLSEGHVYWVS